MNFVSRIQPVFSYPPPSWHWVQPLFAKGDFLITEDMALRGKTKFLLSVFTAILIWAYLNYPVPPLSFELREWKRTGKFLSHGDFKIFYQDVNGTGRPEDVVLCVHGFPTASYDFAKVWEGLNGRFGRIIASDMLGLGFSDKPYGHNYTVSEQASIIEKLLKMLAVEEVHILSHDLGDTVAQELLRRFLYRQKATSKAAPYLKIKSLCLMNGGVFPETNFPTWSQRLMLNPWLAPLTRLGNYYTFKNGFGKVFGPDTQPSPMDFVDFWALLRWNDGTLVMPGLLQYVAERRVNREAWVGALQKSTVPVHMIYGPSDPVNPPVFADRYRELLPQATITVLDKHIGHYPHWEDPMAVLMAYFGFLEKVSPLTQPQATGET
ncbi:mesoderm-specific transcript homolog protein-like isoform X1 [Branchiostoma floridae]|uniref:Mesoderm-specific transcript homolog protein-like isoform X1 n=2 Tax=Branchiostoma floridae TaxID=7739 RepID=A0A9J7MR69_BRAFL|nr:mesoderm-specific transcript homolog protein-like isoform X1 [Branchiostoma floridae]